MFIGKQRLDSDRKSNHKQRQQEKFLFFSRFTCARMFFSELTLMSVELPHTGPFLAQIIEVRRKQRRFAFLFSYFRRKILLFRIETRKNFRNGNQWVMDAKFLCSPRYRSRKVYFKQRRDLQLDYISDGRRSPTFKQRPQNHFQPSITSAERRRRNQLNRARVGSISFMGIAQFEMVESTRCCRSRLVTWPALFNWLKSLWIISLSIGRRKQFN